MADRALASYSGDAPYFFVSYGHDDATLVHPEMRALQDAGFNLWYDEGIHVGAVWRQAIAEALSDAAGIVFLATRSSVESDHCLRELNFALDEGKPVFVLKLDDTKLPSLLRLSLSDRQMLDRANFDDDAYRKRLIDALAAIAPPAPRPGANVESHPIPTRGRSIAVQALATDDAGTAFWAGGLVDDLTTLLGHRSLGQCSVTHDPERDPAMLGRTLHVGYVVSGSVRRADAGYRVNLKLTQAESGTQVWSERYSESGHAIEASDSICRVAAIDISTALLRCEHERAMTIDDEQLDAFGLCLKANGPAGGWRNMRDRDASIARLRLALERDPNFPIGHSMLGGFLSASVMTMFTRTPEADISESLLHVDRALALAPGNPLIMAGAALTHRVFGNEALALDLAERVDAAIGSDDMVHAGFGGGRLENQLFSCLIQAGRLDEAMRRMLDSKPPPEQFLYTVCAINGDWPEALTWARRATATDPLRYLTWVALANALAMCGQLGEAKEAMERVRSYVPVFKSALYEKGMRIAWRNRDSVVEPLLVGLRKLGID